MTLVMTSWNGSRMSGHYDGPGTCDRSRSITEWWSGSSTDSYPFGALFDHHVAAKVCYVTRSFWNCLSDREKTTCRMYAQGIVGPGYFEDYQKEYPWVCKRFVSAAITECFTDACYLRRPDLTPVTDPCKDVSCPDMCVGVDKYQGACQDGICVRGTLIKTGSVHCGYTPEPTPDPTPTPPSATYALIALMLAGAYMILRR